MCLYIFPGAPTLFYQQGNNNLCILSSLVSAFHCMGDVYASEYIIRSKQKSLLEIHNKGRMHFCRDILMGHHNKRNEKRQNYRIEECYTFTQYDIFRNHSTYPTVCLLLNTWKRTDHCITVCFQWIFDSNFEVEFPLTQVFLNYTCRGNEKYEIKFVGVFHVIRAVPTEVVQDSFLLQMGFVFPFLRANDLRTSLLITRTRSLSYIGLFLNLIANVVNNNDQHVQSGTNVRISQNPRLRRKRMSTGIIIARRVTITLRPGQGRAA